jgi:hypothetical protein
MSLPSYRVAISCNPHPDLRSLSAAAPSDGRSQLSPRSREGVPDLATGDLRPPGSMMPPYRASIVRMRPVSVNLAMPRRGNDHSDRIRWLPLFRRSDWIP